MEKQPHEIITVSLECVLMPQGELISLGKTVGWFKDLKSALKPLRDITGKDISEKKHD